MPSISSRRASPSSPQVPFFPPFQSLGLGPCVNPSTTYCKYTRTNEARRLTKYILYLQGRPWTNSDQQRPTNKDVRIGGKAAYSATAVYLRCSKGLYTPIYTPMPIVAVGLSGSHKKKKRSYVLTVSCPWHRVDQPCRDPPKAKHVVPKLTSLLRTIHQTPRAMLNRRKSKATTPSHSIICPIFPICIPISRLAYPSGIPGRLTLVLR